MKRSTHAFVSILILLLALAVGSAAQQASSPVQGPLAPPANAAFLRAADEVMEEVSKLLALPVKSPLKKTIRSREGIRAYLLRQLSEQKNPEKRYADQRVLEKFGLIPAGFKLEPFLVELLTEQIAGLYDPKTEELYIADWVEPGEQRMVMAHELVHALHDQHFKVDKWVDAAKPNDDAELARDAVLEGSATAAMLDYAFRNNPQFSVRNMPDLEPFIRSQMVGELAKSPQMSQAPPFLRDALLFPYLSGAVFTQHYLRSVSGWEEFQKVFEKPPVSTQQILHPDLYLAGVAPEPVALPGMNRILPKQWKKLDENVMGEFGLHGVLKQFVSERAEGLAPAWAGDRYAIFEHAKTKELVLIFRLRLESEAAAARLFGAYSDVLEKKYAEAAPAALFRRPNYFQFQTAQGGVFLRCLGDQCLSVEGTSRAVFDKINRALGWPAAPAPPARATAKVAARATPVDAPPLFAPASAPDFLFAEPPIVPASLGI